MAAADDRITIATTAFASFELEERVHLRSARTALRGGSPLAARSLVVVIGPPASRSAGLRRAGSMKWFSLHPAETLGGIRVASYIHCRKGGWCDFLTT
jgi:hypothetical protein